MTDSPLPALPPAPLRVVFFGTPDLAATVLRALLTQSDDVVGVFTRPDAAKGRGMSMVAPPTKQVAVEHDIPVEQPRGWKDGTALEAFEKMRPDLAVVAAYGRLLPQAALDVPHFGCINVHASLLPRWRGADPISRAILAGDDVTGITIMQMVLEMDAGAILHQSRLPITSDDTGGELERKLATLGGETLIDALALWREGRLSAREQDPAEVTTAPLVQKSDGRVEWTRPAADIERATRALDPWPCATTTREGALLKLWRARVEDGPAGPAGTILSVDKDGPLVATGAGALRLIDVQAAGKRRMSATDWARGARLEPGEVLGG